MGSIPLGKENKQSECFKTDFSEFNLESGQSSSLFPSQCAVGIFNSQFKIDMTHSKGNSSFDYSKANPLCAECKPGYKPVRGTFMNMVLQCVQIANCKSGTNGKSFSRCDECEEGYYFVYDNSLQTNGGIDRTQCI